MPFMPLGLSTRPIRRHWSVWRSSLDDFKQWSRPTPSTQRGHRGKNAKVWTGRGDPDDCCDPAFKIYAARKNREEVELVQAKQKVRDLRGAPYVGEIGGGDDGAEAMRRARLMQRGPARKVRRGAGSVL